MADVAAPSDEAKAAALQSPLPVPDSFTVPMSNPSADPPLLEIQPPRNPPRNDNLLNILMDNDLNKLIIGIAVPIAMGIMMAEKSHFLEWQTSLVLVLLCVGIAAIVCGFMMRHAFPNFDQIGAPRWIALVATMGVPMGIALVTAAFFTVVAFFLPPPISWVPIVCLCTCLLCFSSALRQ